MGLRLPLRPLSPVENGGGWNDAASPTSCDEPEPTRVPAEAIQVDDTKGRSML